MKFDQIVFAGGGNRCWWQAGFWHRLNEAFPQDPERIASISAGAATACLLYARPGRAGAQWGLDYYAKSLAGVKKNARWENLFSGEPVFPHHQLYKNALINILADGFDNLQQAPKIQIGLAQIPSWMGPRSAVAIGLLAYNVEKHIRKSLHPTFGRSLGFKRVFVAAQDCPNLASLVELILQSSCTPPFTPVMYRNGITVLDGGLVDNVPIDGLEPAQPGDAPKEILVLLTRRYKQPNHLVRELPGLRLHYVQPATPVPISSWDYTHQELMPVTYQQGWNDAEKYLLAGMFNS
ncbi:patatin-like phospholipase family protein [Polynucleobacter sp. MWH-Spelu-300-X4]|jgi:predicted acylesterase/phospholipase RssA|uniref:patatin-like phospholipase family protein n=1 Tax=Polynucleobacter sp. MWH-Spelu-300-X4 TaxID=2689109 RepID=UPI001BFD8A2B|nr:patatin-like phospholipase family protein [Polynucleobacter sp. MWH-Spelu-300-X4]QWD79754.1 patatin-like phospholipase family protein [Polynucleobacter sp. MWH-Spelu-300-X4]